MIKIFIPNLKSTVPRGGGNTVKADNIYRKGGKGENSVKSDEYGNREGGRKMV